MPIGRVIARELDGTATILMDGIPSPNGIALAADGCTLYVAVTRANAVWRLPLTPAGAVHRAGQFIGFTGGFGPDGIAVSPQGDLFVAHLGTGIWQFAPDGALRTLFRAPSGTCHVTNVVLDALNARLIVTEASSGVLLQASTS
jgi:gluconolactonase